MDLYFEEWEKRGARIMGINEFETKNLITLKSFSVGNNDITIVGFDKEDGTVQIRCGSQLSTWALSFAKRIVEAFPEVLKRYEEVSERNGKSK